MDMNISLYKAAGLFFVLMSFSSGAFSSYLIHPSLPFCRDFVPFIPAYPPLALSLKIEGRVKFSCDVDSFGRIENVHILEALPHNLFEKSVKDALAMWRYDCYGAPLKGLVYNVVFRLPPGY